MAGNKFELCSRDHGDRNAGKIRKRSGNGIRRSIHAGILETQNWKMGQASRYERNGGQFCLVFRALM